MIFLLYINDLPQNVKGGQVYIYADDTTVLVTAENHLELINKANIVIKEFEEWCKNNHLVNNLKKAVCIEFVNTYGHKNQIQFDINGTKITSTESTKFLGSIIDSNLNFNEQIDTICKKLNRTYFALKSLKSNFNRESLLNLYYAFVYSVLSCNIVVWGRATDVTRVFVIQKRFIRLIFEIGYMESCREIFRANNILTLTSIYIYKLLTYTHKNINHFKQNKQVHSYPTRIRNDIHLPKMHTYKYKKSPTFAGGQLHNLCPEYIKRETSVTKFKYLLKKFLIQNSFYSLEEFTKYKNE